MSFYTIVLYFFVNILLFSQSEITVYTTKTNTMMTSFENDFFTEIIILYNKKNKHESLTFHVKNVSNFPKLFKKMKVEDNHLICGISSVSILKDRLQYFDFSKRYLKENQVLIRNTNYAKKVFNKSTVGYFKNSLNSAAFMFIKKKYPGIKSIEFKKKSDAISALEKNKIDFQIVFGLNPFIKDNREIVEEIPNFNSKGFGIIYPKGSQLKKKLDPIINYYTTSNRYYSLIKRHFGEKLLAYYVTIK